MDIVERLRDTPCNREPFTPAHADCQCRVANEAADEIERLRTDAARYQYLRSRDLDTIHIGGVFAGRTHENVVVNGDDLDVAIDWAMKT